MFARLRRPKILLTAEARRRKDNAMRTLRKQVVALGLAGACLLGTVASPMAAPVASSTAAVKNALPGEVSQIRHRWRRSALPFALGVFGTIAAAAAADAYWERRYYRYPYPYYAHPYPYAYGYHPYAYGFPGSPY